MTISTGRYARRGSLLAYFLEAIQRDTDECIEWPFHTGSHGYGVITVAPKTQRCVHVEACTRTHGPRPSGHEVAHSCDNRSCFNPRHLRWATRAENVADMIARSRSRFFGRNQQPHHKGTP